ncbi:MAG: isochorismatase family protein [Syntrophales bacterium]|nr:isochorismatase family protein [Syntrophales bacterium]
MGKEKYFSRDSIHQKARVMLQSIKRHALAFVPDRSALLILDMQKYFLSASSHAFIPSAQAIIPLIAKLTDAYAKKHLPVIFTRHLNSPQNAGMMAKWWRDLIGKENPASEIIDELDISSGMVLEKSQYDAFFETPLTGILRERGVTQVVVCGVMTHLCCETTARSAFVRGFEVFFTVDGTATYNERFHLATLLNLSHGFAAPALVEELLAAFRGRDAN